MAKSRSFIATPPGATIREQLSDRGMSQKEFAARMDMSEKHISRLINGDVQLTPDMALRLEMVLGAPASFWSNLEAIYREKLSKVETENAMEADMEIAKKLPYSEMAKNGWVPETRDTKEKVIYLRKYFEVVELPLIGDSQITRIACRRLAVTEKSDLALMAWAQEAKLKARSIETAPINIKALKSHISEIRAMTLSKPKVFVPKLRAILADCGIAIVFVPHLKGSFLQGATFQDGNKIVVGMTTRGSDADKFWFSLFHELAHIILGHLNREDGTTDDDEKSADEFSRDTLINQEDFQKLKALSVYTKNNVCDFAKSIGIAPGIVVGRLQKEELIQHNMLNDLKEHYAIVA